MEETYKPTIGIFAKKDPFKNRNEWSGTVHNSCMSIQAEGFNVIWIPYSPNKLKWIILNIGVRLLHGIHSKVRQLPIYAKICAESVDPELLKKCDCYFMPGGGEMLPYLPIQKPSVYLIDATFRLLSGYYYVGNDKWNTERGERRAATTYKSCDRIITSSRWAKQSLLDDYGISNDNISVIPFGANLDDSDIKPEIKSWKPGERLNILFSGVEWKRKGGDIAVDTVKALREKGIDAHLIIAGIKELPTGYTCLDYITNVGFLNKNDKNQYARYLELYSECQIFLLPSKAECSAIVLCEAAGFGLPSFTYDTGGLADYVIDDYNGERLPIDSTGNDFSNKIIQMLNADKLQEYSANARKLYTETLNWGVWGKEFKKLIDELLS